MRKLKLQMQISADFFVAGPNGELDWMTWNNDEKLIAFINELTDSSDTILLGRKMTHGFVNYRENVVKNQPESPEFTFAKKMTGTQKIVLSKSRDNTEWNNTAIDCGVAVLRYKLNND